MNLLRGQTALVTGASSGIGESMARELAARGASLILCARRADRLEALARELVAQHPGLSVRSIVIDLSTPDAAQRLFAETEGAGVCIDILVNNAGAGMNNVFFDIPLDKITAQLRLNVLTLTELTHRFGRAMRERNRGHILNVSSIGAYVPTPYFASYAASKAYIRDFTEALAEEMKDTGVHICCLCPGGTATEFHEQAGQELPPIVGLVTMSSRRCARIGLDALFSHRRNIVSGFLNSFAMFLLRLVPRRLAIYIAGQIFSRLVRRTTPAGALPDR